MGNRNKRWKEENKMKKKLDMVSIWLARAVHNMDFRTAEAFVANRLHVEKSKSEDEEELSGNVHSSGEESMAATEFFGL